MNTAIPEMMEMLMLILSFWIPDGRYKGRELLNSEIREALQHDNTSMTDMRDRRKGKERRRSTITHTHTLPFY